MNISLPYIHPDGSIRRFHIEDEGIILASRDVLANLIPPEWVPVHGLITRQGQPLLVSARRGGTTLAAMILDHIEIKCRWRKAKLEGIDYLIPNVYAGIDHGDNSVEIPTIVSRNWKPPGDIRMYFAILSTTDGAHPTPLFLWSKPDGQFVRPPLSNLYDDGKVCMGGGNVINGSNIPDQLVHAIDLFFSAPYGSHLMPRDNVMEQWFKFIVADNASVRQVPHTKTMMDNLQAIDTDITQALSACIR